MTPQYEQISEKTGLASEYVRAGSGTARTSSTLLDTDNGSQTRHEDSLSVNRARIKGGGMLLREWLSVYGEYDLKGSQWLDYRSTIGVNDWMKLRFGQWKSEFSRERFISSGKQQLVERSISNYSFTLDRQRGLSTSARFWAGTGADLQIWIQALTGLGLNQAAERDNGLIMARVQWNPDGELLPFSGSDLTRREQPVRSLAVAPVTGESQCCRFSSDGCGQLPGYQAIDYDLDQLLLEIVGRVALVDPDTDTGSDLQQEWTLGANWFFNGHRNKLSLDLSWLDTDNLFDNTSQTRLRLQWDLSL